MTNRELLATAFPLHFQRIAEATNDQAPSYSYLSWAFDCETICDYNAADTLYWLFKWRDTEEGWGYWNALANGAA